MRRSLGRFHVDTNVVVAQVQSVLDDVSDMHVGRHEVGCLDDPVNSDELGFYPPRPQLESAKHCEDRESIRRFGKEYSSDSESDGPPVRKRVPRPNVVLSSPANGILLDNKTVVDLLVEFEMIKADTAGDPTAIHTSEVLMHHT